MMNQPGNDIQDQDWMLERMDSLLNHALSFADDESRFRVCTVCGPAPPAVGGWALVWAISSPDGYEIDRCAPEKQKILH